MWVWVFVATFGGNQGSVMTTQEFTTMENCVATSKQIVDKLEDRAFIRVSACVKK